MTKRMTLMIAWALALTIPFTIAACGGSNAKTVSKNIAKECDKFNCLRRVLVTNDITDKTLFEATGRCSFTIRTSSNALDIICKDVDKPGDKHDLFTKATIGLGDNTSWASVQLGGINVSEYRTKIIFRPTSVIPDFDLVTGS